MSTRKGKISQKGLIGKLKRELKDAVKRNHAEGILLSGGVDSSILASLLPRVKAFTVCLESYGEDRRYARNVAQHLGLEHHLREVSADEAIEGIPEVIRILRTFDPAILNDLAIYFGLKLARDKGAVNLMTGDGADELFAGYSFMFRLDLDDYISRTAGKMHFSSRDLSSATGLTVKQPYTDKKFVKFALGVSPELKVVKKGWRTFGKWILRKSFEGVLPSDVVWQGKRPIEKGSGFNWLRRVIESKVTERKFTAGIRKYRIKFLNREHLYYYEVYRKVVGDIPPPRKGQAKCPACGAGMPKDSLHCRTCGSPRGGWKRQKEEKRGTNSFL